MELETYISEWNKSYVKEVLKINLFNSQLTSLWSDKQKEAFVKIFYHLRGHFHDFLWYVGNHAADKETKDIVLKNISEELNGGAASHEQMYFHFAKSLGFDVEDEFISHENYKNYAKDFNHGHLKWLHEHDADERFAALAAYEKLDNIDYLNLLELVKSIKVSSKGQVFFKIHSVVEHFAPTVEGLRRIWEISPEKVKNGFEFIGNHQIKMWQTLSDEIFALA